MNKKQMKITYIVISYNQEDYILETLNGILSQTVLPDEVIIADDGSTDKTSLLIRGFVNENLLQEKWKLILSHKNEGITCNLKKAIKASTGDILLLNAGDDISLPNRSQHAIKLFEQHPNLYIITGSITKINAQGKIIGNISYDDVLYNDVITTIKNGMPKVFPVGQAIRKTLFDRFGDVPTSVPNEDDQITFWGLISGGIFCSSEMIMKYRVHSKSASSWIRNRQSGREFLKRFIEDMPIRKKHMELWLKALEKGDSEYICLKKLIQSKIELYNFFSKIEDFSIWERIRYFRHQYSTTNLREKVYILGGIYGILSWRQLKIILKKQ